MLITTAVLSKLVIFGIGVALSQKVLDSNTVPDKPGLESEAEVGPLPCRPTDATSTAFASLSAAARASVATTASFFAMLHLLALYNCGAALQHLLLFTFHMGSHTAAAVNPARSATALVR